MKTPIPSNGLAEFAENIPNPRAAVKRLNTVNTAAPETAPAIIDPHDRFLPASNFPSLSMAISFLLS